MAFENVLAHLFDNLDNISQHNIYQQKTIKNYWKNHKIKYMTENMKDYSGNYVRPSMLKNVYGNNIQYVKKLKWKDEIQEKENSKIHTTHDIIQKFIEDGPEISEDVNNENLGMNIIHKLMKCVKNITEINKITLEPFQLETIRTLICSSGERLLGQDLCKYIPQILEACGIYENTTKGDFITHGKSFSRILQKNFDTYNKKIIAVIAPRRNGKSKAGKIFVTADAVCEEGARIVLSAHRIEAILLYKAEILMYLKQLLSTGHYFFKIHSSEHEIKLEFPNSNESSIHFVPGGKDVSVFITFILHTKKLSLYNLHALNRDVNMIHSIKKTIQNQKHQIHQYTYHYVP